MHGERGGRTAPIGLRSLAATAKWTAKRSGNHHTVLGRSVPAGTSLKLSEVNTYFQSIHASRPTPIVFRQLRQGIVAANGPDFRISRAVGRRRRATPVQTAERQPKGRPTSPKVVGRGHRIGRGFLLHSVRAGMPLFFPKSFVLCCLCRCGRGSQATLANEWQIDIVSNKWSR